MAPRRVRVRVPATSANLGPGFDCLGLALDLWGTLTVTVGEATATAQPSPLEALAEAVVRRLLEREEGPSLPPVHVSYDGGVPVARGLGASAIARVGGLLAASALLGCPLDGEALLQAAAELEGHADNVAPAVFGGLQVVVRREDGRYLHLGLTPPPGLRAVLFVPDQEMLTSESRQVLPESVSRADAVYNIGRAALLVAALASGRREALAEATNDRLHQPYRARLFPPLIPLLQAAREAGALGGYLSGAGPTVCALAAEGAEAVAQAMATVAREMDVPGRTIVVSPSLRGAEVVGGS